MRAFLLLRFDAPMVSFGSTMVDNLGRTQDYPGLSLLTGLLGNALGFDHGDADRLQRLQGRLRYAVRCDRRGERLTDFHTVDLGQEFLKGTGWTTWGTVDGRAGGSASTGPHIRYRDYLVDAVYTLALELSPADEDPDIASLASALAHPARPLFLGRKCCLPAAPILLDVTQAPTLLDALKMAPALSEARSRGSLEAWWPEDEEGDQGRLIATVDERDWRNQIHAGRRMLRHGLLTEQELIDVS